MLLLVVIVVAVVVIGAGINRIGVAMKMMVMVMMMVRLVLIPGRGRSGDGGQMRWRSSGRRQPKTWATDRHDCTWLIDPRRLTSLREILEDGGGV